MEKSIKKELVLQEGRKSIICVLGALIYASGINFFIVPSGLYNGGVMGICQVIRTILVDRLHLSFGNFDIAGIIYYIVNLPIFALAFTRIGKKFFGKTLLTVTAMTIFLAVLPVVAVVDDDMAACVVGGLISGTGTGLILRMGSSGGGMDVVGVMLTKWRRDFSVGRIGLMVNGILYAVCLFLFQIDIVIYSIIYAAVFSIAMDKGHIQNINVEVHIITKIKSEELEREVFGELGRGITKWQCLGAYTHEESHILYITLSKYEIHQLKTIIIKHDPGAFIVVNEGVSVEGNYLKKL